MLKRMLVSSLVLLVSVLVVGESSQAYTSQEQIDTSHLPLESHLALTPQIKSSRRRGPQIRNPRNVIDVISNLRGRLWHPSPKHRRGGSGTLMDLNDEVAQAVLNRGIPFNNRVYGYHNRRFYRFDYENRTDNNNNGFFHGYPVERNQISSYVQKLMKNAGILD